MGTPSLPCADADDVYSGHLRDKSTAEAQIGWLDWWDLVTIGKEWVSEPKPFWAAASEPIFAKVLTIHIGLRVKQEIIAKIETN